jgi:hypothetical protein
MLSEVDWRPDMRRLPLVACLASILAGCAATNPSVPSAPDHGTTGQWQSLAPEQIMPAFAGSAIPEPLGGRIRRTADDETLLEIYLANASAAPGTNRINVAIDRSSRWRRAKAESPLSGTYEIDPAKRLELLSTYFPGDAQAGTAEFREVPGGKIGLLQASYPDGSACLLAWEAVEATDQRWQPQPNRIFKTMRVCAPTLELDALLRSFHSLDVYRIVS